MSEEDFRVVQIKCESILLNLVSQLWKKLLQLKKNHIGEKGTFWQSRPQLFGLGILVANLFIQWTSLLCLLWNWRMWVEVSWATLHLPPAGKALFTLNVALLWRLWHDGPGTPLALSQKRKTSCSLIYSIPYVFVLLCPLSCGLNVYDGNRPRLLPSIFYAPLSLETVPQTAMLIGWRLKGGSLTMSQWEKDEVIALSLSAPKIR